MTEVDRRVEAFIKELTELTIRHRVVLWACGCCDGINAFALKNERVHGGYKRDDKIGVYENIEFTVDGDNWRDVYEAENE